MLNRAFAAALFLLTMLVACGDSAPTAAVLGVAIPNGDQTLTVGRSVVLSAQVAVTGRASTSVTWATSNHSVATVSPTGRVEAHEPGTAVITARSAVDSTKSDSVTVTVAEETPPTGTITGTIIVGDETTPAHSGLPSSADRMAMPETAVGDAPFVPGEIIVGFAPGVGAQSATPLTVSGMPLGVIEAMPALGVQLLGNRSMSAAETLLAILELRRRPDVRFAHPNYIAQTAAVPNDQFYPFQWHYPAINMPDAWDITTGSSSVVVAVVDTGILHSFSVPSLTHPDLVGKVVPGYDFISDHRVARDGDGRDPDPYDVGDNPFGQSSYHGSHVAGTVAAATNNGTGVAGVDWRASILPVRVLGYGGGTTFDIVQGTLWAAGHSITGVPSNPNPAHVINLSLGGEYTCTSFEQEAFDWIASSSPRRSIVVVAAGNENIDAALFAPANCRNVITVGATDFFDRRAPYSNYGSRIDVMAPGGNVNVDSTGDSNPDGVLSIWRSDATETFGYAFSDGTSMAAPHVAGVASLMKSLDPDITLSDVLAALQATARPLDAASCQRPSGAECGAGLIDAAAALALVRDGAIPAPGVGELVFDPGVLDFGASSVSLDVTLRNTGASVLEWQATQFVESTLNPGDMLDFSVLISDLSGTIPAGGSQVVGLTVDRSLVTADGSYGFAVVFEVLGEAEPAYLYGTFIKADTAVPSLNGPMIVAAFIENDRGDMILSGSAASDAAFADFAFAAFAGANEVIAWSDENGNGAIDAGDYLGVFPDLVDVVAGNVTSGVDIHLDEVIDLSLAPAAVPGSAAREPWRSTLEDLARRRSP